MNISHFNGIGGVTRPSPVAGAQGNGLSQDSPVADLLNDIAKLIDGVGSMQRMGTEGTSAESGNGLSQFFGDLAALLRDLDGTAMLRNAGGAAGPSNGMSANNGAAGVSSPRSASNAIAGAAQQGLSTAPQTTTLAPQQSKLIADAYVSNLQKDFGLTKNQAAGIVANLWHESGGMNSGINQGGKIGSPSSNMADDNANGYGIAQWGGVRKQGLIDYARQHNLDPSSEAANYGYLKQELQTTQAGALAAVKRASSAQEATQAFCNAFEQPSDPQMASRLANLNQILA